MLSLQINVATFKKVINFENNERDLSTITRVLYE